MIFKFACNQDINSWLELLELVRNSFPGLEMKEYKENLQKSIANKEALIAKKDKQVIGTLAFSSSNGELTFLAVHPQYRKMGIARNLIKKMISLFPSGSELSVITYREDDLQGVAARKLYQSMGFERGELLEIFDYPCQKLTYSVK